MKRVSIILGILICFVISFGPVRGVLQKVKLLLVLQHLRQESSMLNPKNSLMAWSYGKNM